MLRCSRHVCFGIDRGGPACIEAAAAGRTGSFPRLISIPKSLQRPDSATVRRVAASSCPIASRVAISIVAILITAAIGLVNPFLLKLIIDDAIPNRDLTKLYLYVGLMIALPIISGSDRRRADLAEHGHRPAGHEDLRERLYSHLQRMPLRFFTETRTGEIQSRLSNDVGGVQRVVTDTATSIVSNVAIAISTVIAMWLLDWRLALISLGMLPIFAS